MRNYARFQDKIDVSRAILVIKDLTCLVGNSSKASMKNDMVDFNVIKFLVLVGKVLCPLTVRWEFPSADWVRNNIDGATKGYPGLSTCGGIFYGSMEEFIGGFSVFLEVQTALMTEFYGFMYAMEETQKMSLTSVWLECDFALVCAAFTAKTDVPGCFVIDETLVLIIVGKSGLGLLIFFVKGMCIQISWLI